MIDAKYGILFTIDLLHKFYANQFCTDFIITPSLQTSEILRGHKIIAKQYEHQAYAGIQLDSGGKPMVVPEEGMQLTFFLDLNNPLFFNYTNLPFSYPSGKIYYFTNRNNNSNNGKNFLSSPISGYDSSKIYRVGDVAVSGSGIIFEAIKSSSSASPFNLSDTSHWAPVDDNRYMSENDASQWLPSLSTYHFATHQSTATILVLGFNAVANNYSTVVLSKTINFVNPVPSFQLDLSTLQPGNYILNVNGVGQNIYVNDELSGNKAFAVIDIFNETTLAAGYQLLDITNNLLSPHFTIYFLNRSTIWKYVLASGHNGDITDNASIYHFTTPSSNTIFSLSPIPLNEKALNLTLTVDSQVYTPIACAAPARLVNFTNGSDIYYCSEIFLNH